MSSIITLFYTHKNNSVKLPYKNSVKTTFSVSFIMSLKCQKSKKKLTHTFNQNKYNDLFLCTYVYHAHSHLVCISFPITQLYLFSASCIIPGIVNGEQTGSDTLWSYIINAPHMCEYISTSLKHYKYSWN